MGRGYWLPPQSETLIAYDGFYIDSDAVYKDDAAADWETFLETVGRRLVIKERTLQRLHKWKSCDAGQCRFVILQNRHVNIIAEDVDDYIAVYVIIPEDCAAPGFAKRSFPRYVDMLQEILTELYPGKIRKRVNSQRTKAVG